MNKRIIRLSEEDLHKIVKESVNRLLTETHTRSLYHFVTPKQIQYIFKYGFALNGMEGDYSPNPKLPNFLSFSRNRNGVQGFPFMNTDYGYGGGTTHYNGEDWLLIRLEIDAERLNKYGKIKPFDYIYHFNKEEHDIYDEPPLSSRGEVAKMATENPNLDRTRSDLGQEVYNQPFSQSEERLFSKLGRISNNNALSLIKRIDVFVDFCKMDEKDYHEFNKFSNWLCNRCYYMPSKLPNGMKEIKLVFYNDINEFNLQIDHPKNNIKGFWENISRY